ncbi:MAG: large subunit ribosomal protein [Patescibacteria group bacterium]|nr:large subunit ribosomal protein [Patescibacteria group bacterium]
MKKYNPTTPSQRKRVSVLYRGVITTNEPHKPLTKGFRRGSGRNAFGRITTRHKGGGHKRSYREIDWMFDKLNIPAKIQTVEYDPNRSGFISLISYADGEKRYILLPEGVKVGDSIVTSEKADLKTGNRMALKNIPVGTYVYNIEIRPNGGAKLVRSAGNHAEVVAHDGGFTSLKLPSTEIRKIVDTAFASIGNVSNQDYHLVNIGKAGRNRWLGVRPTTRGSVMNPVDHPYGGGEGRQRRGTKRPKTKWGKVTGGRKTRTSKKYSNVHIVARRSNGVRNKESKL